MENARTLYEIFELAAQKYSKNAAISYFKSDDSTVTVSFEQLRTLALNFAHHLRAEREYVALYSGHSLELVSAILGFVICCA